MRRPSGSERILAAFAIVREVKRALVTRDFDDAGEARILDATGATAFVVTPDAIRCAGCGRHLKPRDPRDRYSWSTGKSRFVRDHVACTARSF